MRIESVDFFYLSMPRVTTEADGSQDALLVRVRAGAYEGFGECEAAPLPSIAAFVCPLSHGACQPVSASVLGQSVEGPADIERIAQLVAYQSMDVLQAAHTWSGIEMALWDLLGKSRGQPVWQMLGYQRSHPKTPYFSVLFGDTPEQTLQRARQARASGFRAAKFGWGPIGRESAEIDREHFMAAREGLQSDGVLLVDVGQIFASDVDRAAERLPALQQAGALWLEEPFQASAYACYRALAERSGSVRLAGGEGAHNLDMARHLIDYGSVGYVQIDCGRIGGIGPAKAVADHARSRGVTYVNHTFTSHLALSASLQPYAGLAEHVICEYPGSPKPLALAITTDHLLRDANGQVSAPERPGLGMQVDLPALAGYVVDTEIRVKGRVLYRTPALA
ncbi:MAG: mandelate racemase/muconate lactonizing enzyme family protein [Comamonadaceae bacterium]|jgi:L-alanine-DL-glutamate epimerase-like enolase superfamily enzyme|nr:mandelate racemase/muconate lactonizing enzyme family protein [Comamonadaceae bacterium]